MDEVTEPTVEEVTEPVEIAGVAVEEAPVEEAAPETPAE